MRSKTVLIGIAVLLCFLQSTAYGLDLTPESKLRKLSFQMRGFPPSSAEFTELSKNKTSDVTLSNFFSNKVEEYYRSPWAASKLAEKLFEDWRLDNSGDDLDTKLDMRSPIYALDYISTSGDTLTKSLRASLANGDSWDQILISNSFKKMIKVTNAVLAIKQIYDFYGATRIHAFKKKVLESGKKIETEQDILAAIDLFESEKAALDDAERAVLMQGYQPTPYLRNSHLDKKLTVLIIQGALDAKSPNHFILVEHLKKINDLDSYTLKILASTYVKTYNSNQVPVANPSNLPQLIFSQSKISENYQNSIYSKAAAFFRIYLCDVMQQVAVPGPGSKSQAVFKMIQPSENSSDIPPPPPNSATSTDTSKPHVQPQCLGCHSKLDPMETIFNNKFDRFTSTEGNQTPFNFVYDDFNGKSITVTIPNIDDLPDVISKQPQYIRCQSEKFWNWYIGSDVPLNPKQRAELERVYIASESKPLEIIKYLTTLKVYTSDSFLSEPKQFNNIRPFMQKCQGCHKSDPTIPSLLEIPFNYNRTTPEEKLADHYEILKNVVTLTNILGNQKGIKMPTKDSGWKISESEQKTLVKWIADGAKDENGVDTITPDQKNKILAPAKSSLMATVNQPSQLVPTLRPTWQRVLTYSEILKTIPLKIANASTYNPCFSDIISKKQTLGHIDLNTALPISDQPDNAYRETYRQCVVKLLNQFKLEIKNHAAANINTEAALKNSLMVFQLISTGLFSLAIESAKINPTSNVFAIISQMNWNTLSDEHKLRVIREQTQFILGPNQNHVPSEKDLDQTILKAIDRVAQKEPSTDLISASFFSLYYLLNSNSFLVY